jgi:transcription-repair coupling factor (superfamily II helicase)
MKLSSEVATDRILVVSLAPYFLERDVFWFEKNLEKILEARKTQSFFQDHILFLERGQVLNLSQFLRKLDEMGYEKVLKVEAPGEFSQRGGLVEIFPINSSRALLFEFLGNKIENIEKLPIEIKDERKAREILKKKLKSQKLFSDLKGLKSGDYLVHLDHGIGRFKGMTTFPRPNVKYCHGNILRSKDDIQNVSYYNLEYAHGDRLYVPIGLERKLSRYVGFTLPKISRLGSSLWQRTKKKVKEEAEKLARELLEIYAQREITTRPPYLPEDEIDLQLASDFHYLETPDQIEAIEEIKKDLEGNRPMDRILCGDVGFGKTEVALRAMIKVVKSGYQTAMICPTTILAYQHFQNFKERLKNLPIRIAMLSRLQPKKGQKEIIEELKRGEIDIVVGTHRILSKDIESNKLGLLIIDDEHRFGVRQKEKFKKMRSSLDVLSLSATPIPRTLYLALSSLKSISFIQTPPEGRLPVKTFILPLKEKIVAETIEKEVSRGGQVYYLHNRVETIGTCQKFLAGLIRRFKPGMKFGIAHGRLKEKKLVKVMADFQNKKIDVLVATTIIENGLDLPNVNTLIVADATRLGLSQAYQIRGRVGRSHLQAFAYFLYPKRLSSLAKERLQALKGAETLGSGYKIALKDLEIRGAGNILGKEQSGNINQVGLNLYCQMLSEAVEKIKQSDTNLHLITK